MDNDIYMDTVRFLTFVNIVLSCSGNRNYCNINKVYSTSYKLCKNNIVYCPICISDVSPNEYIRVLECNHTFHKKCIDKWIKKCILDESKMRCPMCRKNI